MAENRDEILANFQACTGIDDLEEAICHLEQTDWDLLRAINRALPQDITNVTTESSPDIEMVEEITRVNSTIIHPPNSASITLGGSDPNSSESIDMIGNESAIDFPIAVTGFSAFHGNIIDAMQGPSTSSHIRNKPRSIRFEIHHQDHALNVELTEDHTVGDLKKWLLTHTGVAVCRQILLGWRRAPHSDATLLKALSLPQTTQLTLSSPDPSDGHLESDNVLDRINLTYTLNIKHESREYNLKYPGVKSILDVKTDLYTLTNIPTRYQQWTGWPSTLNDESTLLGCSGINYPVHGFTLKSTENNEEKKRYKRIIKLDSSDDSSVDEFEDAAENFTGEDDMFITETRSRKLQDLIPDKVEDETAGCLHFADEFTSRYGAVHPEFFPGTLDDAIKEACMKPAREKRLMAVYLHHDGSVLSNVFCAQILCCDSVVQCLTANFVVWAWDLTYEWNELKFFASLSNSLGAIASMQIKNIPKERLPAIVIISRLRSVTEITAVIQGTVGVSELMTALTEAVDVFTMQQKVEVREEDERTAREMIMFEQDAAYRESLEMDRAKEQAKKQQEMIESKEKEKAELQKREDEAKKEAERLEIESRLPVEPSEGSTGVTKFRIRLPKGEFIERGFYVMQPLQHLLDYLVVAGYPPADYKVISSWPRRDLTALDISKTFQELKLFPQETVILEER